MVLYSDRVWLIIKILLSSFWTMGLAEEQPQTQEILDWLLANGGTWNAKQEIRADENGLVGVYAKENIEAEELLVSVPWSCIIAPMEREWATQHRFKDCDVVNLLAEELSNYSSSSSPYISSLSSTAMKHTGLLPTDWSPQGKDLLRKVTADGVLPPKDPFMEDFAWKRECESQSSWHRKATRLVVTHGEDIGMVPVTDKYNHHGGMYNAIQYSDNEDEKVGLEVYSIWPIEAGEQIVTDYRDEIIPVVDGKPQMHHDPMGTPELLREYGFVEDFPQRWIFKERGIVFDLEYGDVDDDDDDDEEEEDADIEVVWGSSHPLSEQDAEFFSEQLVRLKDHVYPELTSIEKNEIPQHELGVVIHYCEALMNALASALDEWNEDDEKDDEEL